MKHALMLVLMAITAIASHAQDYQVTYLEKVGTGGTRVFAVQTSIKDEEIETVDGKAKLKPAENACYQVLNAILFEGVENYNDGNALVFDRNNAFAKSIVNPKKKAFMTYCKAVELENSIKNKQVYHYIIEVNHFNLLRLLEMRGSLGNGFTDN